MIQLADSKNKLIIFKMILHKKFWKEMIIIIKFKSYKLIKKKFHIMKMSWLKIKLQFLVKINKFLFYQNKSRKILSLNIIMNLDIL